MTPPANRARTYRPMPMDADSRRLFIAVPLAEDARAAVERVVERVRAAELEFAPDARAVRWVRVDGLHLTLRFLGATPEARRPDIEAAVVEAARGTASFRIRIAGAGAFPNASRPRALWLGVDEGLTALADVARRLDDCLAGAGYPPESRPFRAHLTLARSDGVSSGSRTVERLVAESRDIDAAWTADRVTLFESLTGGGPARYVRLLEAKFGGASPG